MSTALQSPSTSRAPLFSQVSFHIILCEEITPGTAQEISHKLTANGATEHAPPSKSGQLHGLTHIISRTIDFEAYGEATSRYISVVMPDWIEASLTKKRLANPKSHSPDPRLFYSGLVICTAGLPEGDKDAIIGGVLAMGGLYSASVSKLVTHIVALSMEHQACDLVKTKGLRCKIVLPHWFDDCLRLGKRIDESPYLLPNPDILRTSAQDQVVTVSRPDLLSALSPASGPLPAQLIPRSPERERLKVFENKSILLGDDLGITDHLRRTIEEIIEQGCGRVAQSITDAHIYICQYRDGCDYVTASTSGKIVANLPWLYHLCTTNTWTSPMKRLLHYPIARDGLPGVKDFRISLSNYNGEARVYLENLAKAAGCEFTKTMKQDNTHLITAHTVSEKCDAAKEWNIHMVNHLWLEESYSKWQVQSVANHRYTYFPARTNLTEVVGQTPIDRDALSRHFFAKHPQTQRDTKKALSLSLSVVSFVPPEAPEDPTDSLLVSRPKPTKGITINGVSAPTPPRDRSGDGNALETPGARIKTNEDKENKENKENITPSTSGSRSAKDRAMFRLHGLAPDIALYEKEKKRVGGVIFGGRREQEDAVASPLKRAVPPAENTDTTSEGLQRASKRVKQSRAPLQMRVLVTGYPRWTENMKLFSKDKEHLRTLGLLLTQDYKNCAYLIAPKILRTQKFCCAVAHSPTILSTKYLEACIQQNVLLDPEDYLLEDRFGENRYGLRLSDVLSRASSNKGRLLKGQTIWVTEGIHGGFESYKSIIEVNGGKCALYRGRTGSLTAIAPSNVEERARDGSEWVYLASGPTRSEAQLWPKFCQMAKSSEAEPKVVRTDWLLDLALSQQSQWKDSYELTEADIVDPEQAASISETK